MDVRNETEIRRLRKVVEGQGLSMQAMGKELSEARAEIARLRSPVEADVMEIAHSLGFGIVHERIVAHALQQYGDARAREAIDKLKEGSVK